MDKFIPLSVPNLKGNELEYVTTAVKDEWVSTGGSFISDFEKAVAKYVNALDAVACQSGTAGLHLSLVVEGIGEGDEVIVPTLTFIAAVNPVKYVNAEPVFMDCDDTLCMDMDKVEKFCEEECDMQGTKLINKKTGKHVKAMVIVHVFGNIANMEKAMELAEKYHLVVIEDATEAMGSYINEGKYKGRFAGTIGNLGVYSFNGNKIITTGGGGMVVSNDKKLIDKVRYLSTQAKDDTLYFIHNNVGYNYRMTNLQAALGLAQLEQLDKFINTKKKNYEYYQECGIKLLPFRQDIRTNHWFYSYMTGNRDELIKYLSENQIQARPIWYLISELEPYKNCQKYHIEKSKEYWKQVVNVPCSTNLSFEDVEYVAEKIKAFMK